MIATLKVIYVVIFVLLMLLHLTASNFKRGATLKWRGRVVMEFPGFFAALFMSLTWPITLPMQLWQNRGGARKS